MRQDTTEKALKLILMLLDAKGHTVEEICEELKMSRRTLYYTLESLRNLNFIIFKTGNSYHIDRRSPFISELTHEVQFSDAELLTIWNMLTMAGDSSDTVAMLRKKLDAAYDFSRSMSIPGARQRATIVKKLIAAIQRKRMVKICNYSSPNSHSVKDRIVEPYLLMNDNRDVRCHELSSGVNKTFKIARMSDVEVLDTSWIHEDKHRQMFTDIFMFSGEEHHNVQIRVGQLTRNLFLEEFPRGAKNVRPDDGHPDHWIIDLEVCDYRGIGRFVLGLFEDIEIIGGPDFKEYIRKNIKAMYNRIFSDK